MQGNHYGDGLSYNAIYLYNQNMCDCGWQGDIVRQLKQQKADQAKVTAEVERLLALKRELCVAQGIDPNQAAQAAGGKKKRGKKKWCAWQA